MVGGQGDCRVSQRRRALRDRGLGAHTLSGLDRMTEQRPEGKTGAVFPAGEIGRGSHLTEDLALSQCRGVDPGRNLEQMGDRGIVHPAGEQLRKHFGIGSHGIRIGPEEALDVGEAVVKALDDGVYLGAQARREDDRLRDVLAAAKHLERLGQVALWYRALLEDVERHVPFVDPHGNDRHGAATSFLSGDSLWPSRPR